MAFKVERKFTLEFSLPSQIVKNSSIARPDVVESLKSTLKGDFSKVKCVQPSVNGRSFRVTFKDGSQRAFENLFVKGLHIKNSFFFLNEAEPSCSVLLVSNLPSELDDSKVKDFFSKFGDVRRITRILDRDGIETGDRRVMITLSHNIPSRTLLSPYIAYVKYRGQPQCCHHCNWWGHTIYRCHLKNRCGQCAGTHPTHQCLTSLVQPPSFPVTSTMDEILLENPNHPALVADRTPGPGLSDPALYGSMESLASNHTNDLFDDDAENPPVQDLQATLELFSQTPGPNSETPAPQSNDNAPSAIPETGQEDLTPPTPPVSVPPQIDNITPPFQ